MLYRRSVIVGAPPTLRDPISNPIPIHTCIRTYIRTYSTPHSSFGEPNQAYIETRTVLLHEQSLLSACIVNSGENLIVLTHRYVHCDK